MDRREFLHPGQLAKLAAPVFALPDAGEAPSSSAAVMLRFARRAMATTFEAIVPFATPAAHECAEAALDEIDRLEEQLSVYREHSEVSRINRTAALQPVHCERGLFDLLLEAERIHRDTGGAFDIAVGALIKAWGFFRRSGRVPGDMELAAVRHRIGMRHVTLDRDRQTILFHKQGVEINLGSIGKGYALDRAARRAETENILMHGGHSSMLALGAEAPGTGGWTVGLSDPVHAKRRRAWIHLRNCGMATSAMTHQHFSHEGKKLGHLLDPRTAWPAEGILSATALAPTAAEADALATAFFILGVEPTRAYCERHPEIGAVMIAADAPERVALLGRAGDCVHVIR